MGSTAIGAFAPGELGRKMPSRSAAALRDAAAPNWEIFEPEETRLPRGLLPTQAALWEKSYFPDGLLLRGQALQQAEAWALRHEAELGDIQRDYLIACQAAESCARHEQARNGLLRILLAAVTMACVMALWHWLDGRREAGTYLAARDAVQTELLAATAARAIAETQLAAEASARQEIQAAQSAAIAEREQAQRSRLLAESRALAAFSDAALSSDARLAILLAIESARAAQLSGLPGSAGYAGFAALDRAVEQLRARERQSLRRSLRSPDGARALDILADGTAAIRQNANGRTLATLSDGGWIDQAAWSPDGARILAGGCAGRAAIFDAASGALLLSLAGHHDLILHVGWSADGARAATASRDGVVLIWEACDGARTATLQGHIGGVWNVVWSPDSARLVTLGLDQTALLWQVTDGRRVLALDGHARGVAAVAWDRTATTLASVGAAGEVLLWDVASGRATPLFGKLRIERVAWGMDNRHLLAANHDGETFLWDGASVTLLASGGETLATLTLDAPESAPTLNEESPTCAQDAPEATDDLLAYACRRAGRNLTTTEWARFLGAETPYKKTCADLP